MPDIECPQCGHRALSVATRCPRCGHEFPPELVRPLPSIADRGWLRPVLLVAGGLALLLAISRSGSDTPPPPISVSESPEPPPAAADSVPPAPRPAPPAVQPAQPPTQARQPAAAPLQRYATTWVNVRRSPSQHAPTVRVLNPGEAVLVDSLRGGWYRLVAEGRTLGYAHRRLFEATMPAATP